MDTSGTRLRLLWSDLLGLERGKYLYGDWQDRGRANFCLTTLVTIHDREILPVSGLAFDVGLPDLEATLDPRSLRSGWEPNTMVGIGDLSHHHEALELDPRHILRRAIEPWSAMGLEPQIAFEFEFYLLRPDGGGGWRGIETPSSRVYGTGMAVDPDGIVGDIVDTAAACGLSIEAWCTEFDDGQFEVNIRYRDALEAADDAFLFRLLAREVAAKHGHRATFMGRPWPDRGGSGLHVNLSFRDREGHNALHDPKAPDGLTELAHRCIAGQLAYHEATAAILAPTVNAYKRLLPDMMNGYHGNWGHDDRTVAVRISPDRGPATRLENRVADGAVNPYLAAATMLHISRFGLEDRLEAPATQPRGEPPVSTTRIPANLLAAVKAFEGNARLRAAFGEWFVETWGALKRAEWQRYLASGADPAATELTDWELAYYQPFV